MFRRNLVNLDVAFIQVSLPDSKGFCSLGTSVDCTRAAIQNAKHIIALANPRMPRTFGDGIIHSSHIGSFEIFKSIFNFFDLFLTFKNIFEDVMVYVDYPLYKRDPHPLSEEEKRIGSIIAENLVDHGATLQMGIGTIPDAVLTALKNHKNLGVHTEMFSDGVLDLINCGALNNSQKRVHPGKLVTSFLLGSQRLYDFVNDNPMLSK